MWRWNLMSDFEFDAKLVSITPNHQREGWLKLSLLDTETGYISHVLVTEDKTQPIFYGSYYRVTLTELEVK
jgi:hypothetical protein